MNISGSQSRTPVIISPRIFNISTRLYLNSISQRPIESTVSTGKGKNRRYLTERERRIRPIDIQDCELSVKPTRSTSW